MFIQYTYIKHCFAFGQNWVIMTAIFSYFIKFISQENGNKFWAGLYFYWRRLKATGFIAEPKLLLVAVRWEAEGSICTWSSHLHIRLRTASAVQCCRLKEEGAGPQEWAGKTTGSSGPGIDSISSFGRKYIFWSFPIFCSRMSVQDTATVLVTWPQPLFLTAA